MKKNSILKRNIMTQVYVIYTLRKVFSMAGASFMLTTFSLFEILTSVSVRHVLANMPSLTRPSEVVTFHYLAFQHAGHIVQMSLLTLFVAVTLYASTLIREITSRGEEVISI